MKVVVFGLGYVGTVSAACLAAAGHDVWGVDVDPTKVDMISDGRSPVVEPGLGELVQRVVGEGRLRATTCSAEAIAGADVSLVCVGTPSTPQGATNLSHVQHVVENLVEGFHRSPPRAGSFHVVVMRSTVPPGTVETMGQALAAGTEDLAVDVGVAMCPEFLREGTGLADFYAPPYTVIGAADHRTAALLRQLFAFVDRPVHEVDLRTAEALKYACNAFHATKVSFANEMGRLLRRFGVDSRKVMDLFCQDRQLNISPVYLRPGFAFGGSCLPKDLRSLLQLARMESIDLPLLSGVLATNTLSVADVVDRIVAGPHRRVAMLGLSFKGDSDDLRESPYVDLAESLLGKGFDLRIYDPIINPARLLGANRQFVDAKLPHLRRILTEDVAGAVEGADLVIVSSRSPEVVETIGHLAPSVVVFDLDGRLGPEVELRPGYEGVVW